MSALASPPRGEPRRGEADSRHLAGCAERHRPQVSADTDDGAGGGHTARMNQIVACPEPGCELAAEVVSRWVWPSTDGPAEHVKVFCLHGHARTLLSAWLVTPARLARVIQPSARLN